MERVGEFLGANAAICGEWKWCEFYCAALYGGGIWPTSLICRCGVGWEKRREVEMCDMGLCHLWLQCAM